MAMEDGFDNKINILKAFAIILVVSGHLQVSVVPFFPTYSFHLALFFFISGYLFKESYLDNILKYIKRKAKSLLVPYFWYYVVYLAITIIIAIFTNKFLGSYQGFSIKNYFLRPMAGQVGLILLVTLWFVYQLFVSLVTFSIVYKILKIIWNNKIFHFVLFLALALLGIQLSVYNSNYAMLICIRTLFSMFFIYTGLFYKNFVEEKINILSYKSIGALFFIQSILWLFNVDTIAPKGRTQGLCYLLYNGSFYNPIVPVLTSLTGIWFSLFLVNIFYPYLKNNKFIEQIGKNTYHIMVNHVVIIYMISNGFLYINNIIARGKENSLVFWVYHPEKTTWIYFLIALIASTYIGVAINYITDRFKNRNISP